MLEELSISGLGVIDSAGLEFGPGLNVLTGETGAGKTMVVSALGLLLGARADSGAVRQGSSRARVQGRVRVDPTSPVAVRAVEAGSDLDDDALILARTVTPEGRSRASAGGAAVPATVLSELAADLVVVHGQSDQQVLLSPARQRDYLDAFGGPDVLAARDSYREAFDRLAAVSTELDAIVGRARERAQEADLLRFGIGEITALEPRPGEDALLVAEESRLAHVDGLRRAADDARYALSGDDALETANAIALVAGARKSLEAERDHDPALATVAESLAAASYALADAAADLSSYAESLETDPIRLGVVQDRRARLGALSAKYGDTIDDVLQWLERAQRRVTELDESTGRADELRADQALLRSSLSELGAALSSARREAADRLEVQVTAELSALAMPHAAFRVVSVPLAAAGRDGIDEVTFSLSSSPGAEPRPLQRGASGGELSRVMLAIEVCLAGTQPVPTMVFDEVDAGVGGKAAVEVGRRLARLARDVQVIVVTHLPQVAAFADRHYVVVKSSDGQVTTSGVTVLDEAGRRTELSRMLAGLENSRTALAHADELVELAKAERSA
ncbi:MAG: repair protein RecN [Nocardioidaceae bacterium]|jgi:DNA repair protein RecN (Recombination protein N)|nr:repair protein RecN [Nocardioidaceae bacterium]